MKERVKVIEPPDECSNKTICRTALNLEGARGMSDDQKLNMVVGLFNLTTAHSEGTNKCRLVNKDCPYNGMSLRSYLETVGI